MIKLLAKDLAEGKKLLTAGEVLHVLFSEGTYQVEVASGKESVWPFLQLDDEGHLLDAFCTCKVAEKKGSCPHLAAALLKINAKDQPLHVRFRKSLWNQLGLISCKRHGEDAKLEPGKEGSYNAKSVTGKRLLTLRPHTPEAKKQLETILFHRPLETEETSLKFSKLSPEEIALWRQGRPSYQLRYELSFWSDLAKWWMTLQEEKVAYTLTFLGDEPLPNELRVSFPELDLEFYISRSNWPDLIPSLSTVNSPLRVFPLRLGRIEKVTYRPENGSFLLTFAEGVMQDLPSIPEEEALVVGEWFFVPGKGFYPKQLDPLLEKEEIGPDRVNDFLQKYHKLIATHLKENLHAEGVPIHYELFFDRSKALHLDAFLFQKGDLGQRGARYFGDWVYLPEKGFFLLENQLFAEKEKVIPKPNVADFVNRHRVWLQSYEGFQPHLSTLESHLGFQFNAKGQLEFFTQLEIAEESEEIVDFGEWVYVKEKGFYARASDRAGLTVKAGLTIESYEISSFIDKHRLELESVPQFFSSKCPLEKSGLSIRFNPKGVIEVSPEFIFAEGYSHQKVGFFGDYTYVPGEGFALIPPDLRLPQTYRHPRLIDSIAEPYFIGYELDLLSPYVFDVDPRLKKPSHLQLKLKELKRQASGWLLELSYETEMGEVPAYELWNAIHSGRSYLFSEAGLLLLSPTRFEWLRQRNQRRWLQKGSKIKLTTVEFFQLCALEELQEPAGDSRKEENSRTLYRDFLSLKPPSEIDLSGLTSELRAYQKAGVNWLWFLHSYGLSGLLCDEMGLGKTHQAMALIAGLHNSKKPLRVLVVCPTSVIYHWEELLKRFLPRLRCYVFHGIQRKWELFNQDGFEILLTSYGVLRSEQKALSTTAFDLAIFDEVQVAKNEKAQVHQALRKVKAHMRLGLSGTPIENRLLELKALFDLIIPNYLPPLSLFRDLFVNPIERYGDPQKKNMLSRLIRPFVLRRRKADVLTELPEKIEEVAYCDLSEEQHELYRQVFHSQEKALLTALADSHKPPPITHIFSLLSKLKQVCDHPCLITGNIEEYDKHHSGKWELLLQLLDEIRDSGQKVVIFSQYLTMLDIMMRYLESQKIGYAQIRGSTIDRKEQVKRFQEDPDCLVFLGSLQAAGVGIDLTAGSVVIHYDRWWNPAKENQATDRVHRIGQKRGVQVFKLVTKHTVEEHIDKLIESKLSLAKGILSFDEQDQIKGLDRAELIALLQALRRDL